ncbi:putative ORFA (plasmid) [Bacillus anthracis str. Vollum]|uniref:Truncated ORFA n=1 Tax=Bacillus anthracis TaxID=1392 RepID=Q57062_BACAN|nr:truncated ORFA [Bacillus anthracis]AIK60896.1 putative ORFA [Bacillus anthracis str. Vollum]AJG51092.1 putative ORFA [Bacillus anthracis str. Turkey32]AJH43176.1 putative transposase [Bacillus anthracis str. Sterne]AJH97109.1 putative transposase [Bacillus anthracis str. V770-NP-1R]EVT89397.1 hypothetical protein U368_28610 [Bacillus anthracis 8903-G]EVT95358.1 hypothetical protein U365_28025 [Bacillus anthracis 9080-G]EVU02004.1 hypothetical protein U369_28800 [Bacillus anthracis 52-G]
MGTRKSYSEEIKWKTIELKKTRIHKQRNYGTIRN